MVALEQQTTPELNTDGKIDPKEIQAITSFLNPENKTNDTKNKNIDTKKSQEEINERVGKNADKIWAEIVNFFGNPPETMMAKTDIKALQSYTNVLNYILPKMTNTLPQNVQNIQKTQDALQKEINSKLVQQKEKEQKQIDIVHTLRVPPTFKEFQNLVKYEIRKAIKTDNKTAYWQKNNLLKTLGAFMGIPVRDIQDEVNKMTVDMQDNIITDKFSHIGRLLQSSNVCYDELNNLKRSEKLITLESNKNQIAWVVEAEKSQDPSKKVSINEYTLGDIYAVTKLGSAENDKKQNTQRTNYIENSLGNTEKIFIPWGIDDKKEAPKNLALNNIDSLEHFEKYIKDLDLNPSMSSDNGSYHKRNELYKVGYLLASLWVKITPKTIRNHEHWFDIQEIREKIESLNRGRILVESHTGVSNDVFLKVIKPRLERKYPWATIGGPKEWTIGTVSVWYTKQNIVDSIRQTKSERFTSIVNSQNNGIAWPIKQNITNLNIANNGAIVTMDVLKWLMINNANSKISIPETSILNTEFGINNIKEYNNEILSKLQEKQTLWNLQISYEQQKPVIIKKNSINEYIQKNLDKNTFKFGAIYNIVETEEWYKITMSILSDASKSQLATINTSNPPAMERWSTYNARALFPEYTISTPAN